MRIRAAVRLAQFGDTGFGLFWSCIFWNKHTHTQTSKNPGAVDFIQNDPAFLLIVVV